MTLRRAVPNIVTLMRVPVIVLLAVVVSPDDPTTALGLFLIGIMSHGLDGMLAKYLWKEPRNPGAEPQPGRFWHELDTAYLSLGLQLAAMVWLVRADVFPWWVIPAYLAVTFFLEFKYVQVRKGKRPFVPMVLIGSGVVWVVLTFLLIRETESPTGAYLLLGLALVSFVNFHALMHPEVWKYWRDEARNQLPGQARQ